MFKVKKQPLTPNTIWDGEKGEPLCKFTKGIFETNDEELAEKLKSMGYEVTGEPDKESDKTSSDTPSTILPESPVSPVSSDSQTASDQPNAQDVDDDSENGENDQTGEPDKESGKPKGKARKTAGK